MTPILTTAEDLICADLSVIPVRKDKRPALESWIEYQDRIMPEDKIEKAFTKAHGIAVICGKVSGGLECIDFDAHSQNIEAIFKEWASEDGVLNIIKRNRLYTERSPSGGYHVFYRYESGKYDGSQKLANWQNGTSMIETKGEGGYVIISPTPGYKELRNSLTTLATITYEEREYLISYARQFTQDSKPKQQDSEQDESLGHEKTDPVSWFNWNKAAYAKNLLKEKGWVLIDTDRNGTESWRRPGKTEGTSATWGNKHNALYIFSTSVPEFKAQCYYNPFQIITKLRFKNNYLSALNWVVGKYYKEEVPYVRIGTDYYKKIKKIDRFDIERTELKAWKKDEIRQDEGKTYLDRIPHFDDFTIEPDNFNYHPVIGNCYNLYKEFSHKPEPGSWYWTEILLRHIFAEQYDLGLRYIQALYLHPKRMLPILVLVSRERQTGKTTFLNWLNVIFGDNMVNISPEDLAGSFNHIYATSNIIGIEETLIEKSLTVEKLKSLATGKFVSVNQKFVQQFKIPFYGKIILASNNEDKFARIDEEEIRFFVRKVELPKHINHSIEDDMKSEIPAFLHYLTTLPPIDWSRDRTGFTPDEIANETLRTVKEESKNWMYKEIREYITDYFHNNSEDEIFAIPADIKQKWFQNNSRAEIHYIRNVLRNDFKLKPSDKIIRYTPIGGYGLDGITKTGTPFCFKREDFINNNPDVFVKNSEFVKNKIVPF